MKLPDPKVGDFAIMGVGNERVCYVSAVTEPDDDRFVRKGTVLAFDGDMFHAIDHVSLGYLKGYDEVIKAYEKRIMDMRMQIMDMSIAIQKMQSKRAKLQNHLKGESPWKTS